ncbi:MAG: VCBS repeat-containing protein [Phycisphaerales bacterium]|nr:VCBS repeat-containing protein [Phycisphaerales bacterium]
MPTPISSPVRFTRLLLAVIATAACAYPALAQDLDGNLQQDSLELRQGALDCNHNAILDIIDIGRPHFSNSREHLNGVVQFQNNVWDVAPLDFNLDGKMDLALCAFTSTNFGHVAFWRNDGGPGLTFHSEIPFPNARPTIIKSADVNADGRPDLIAADSSYNRVYVLRATGDGTFAASVTLQGDTSNNGSVGLALGDLDNDGDTDIAATSWGTNKVNVWRNTGAGTFGPRSTISVSFQPRDVAIGDFTGDGLPDLAVANEFYSSSPPGADGTVSLLRNTGTTFVAHGAVTPPRGLPPYMYQPRPQFVELRDTDHDGDTDLVVSSKLSNVLSVHANDGAGNFSLSQTFGGFPIEGDPRDVRIADLDADGWEDIVWGDPDTSAVIVLRNNAGTFEYQQSFATSIYGSLYLAIADFSGDGSPDILSANNDARTFSVLVNKGQLDFDAPIRYRLSEYPGNAILADFNTDGVIDLGTVNTNQLGDVYTFYVHTGLGDARFSTIPIINELGVGGTMTFARDLNNDGLLDLLTVTGRCEARLGNGDGTFGPAISSPIQPRGLRLTIADYNVDGNLDLMWLFGSHPSVARISFGDGQGSFGVYTEYTMLRQDESVAFGDITGDGAPEFFAGFRPQLDPAPGGVLSWLPNNGDGTFGERQDRYIQSQPLNPAVNAIAVADFDRDGDNDVAVTALGLRYYSNPGDGNLPAVPDLVNQTAGSILIAADIDLDGDVDLYARNATLSVLLNNGDATFPPAMHLHRYNSNYRDLFVADANGDGRPDAMIRPENSWSQYLFLNLAPFSADLNANGIPDDCEDDGGCPADFDQSGTITSADITAFLAAWFSDLASGTASADINLSGFTTSADITAFLGVWFGALQNGC